jgi:hypothetical protein
MGMDSTLRAFFPGCAYRQVESLEMQNRCAEIKIRAERKAREMLAETEKNPGGTG